jgi:hypothetical protein
VSGLDANEGRGTSVWWAWRGALVTCMVWTLQRHEGLWRRRIAAAISTPHLALLETGPPRLSTLRPCGVARDAPAHLELSYRPWSTGAGTHPAGLPPRRHDSGPHCRRCAQSLRRDGLAPERQARSAPAPSPLRAADTKRTTAACHPGRPGKSLILARQALSSGRLATMACESRVLPTCCCLSPHIPASRGGHATKSPAVTDLPCGSGPHR